MGKHRNNDDDNPNNQPCPDSNSCCSSSSKSEINHLEDEISLHNGDEEEETGAAAAAAAATVSAIDSYQSYLDRINKVLEQSNEFTNSLYFGESYFAHESLSNPIETSPISTATTATTKSLEAQTINSSKRSTSPLSFQPSSNTLHMIIEDTQQEDEDDDEAAAAIAEANPEEVAAESVEEHEHNSPIVSDPPSLVQFPPSTDTLEIIINATSSAALLSTCRIVDAIPTCKPDVEEPTTKQRVDSSTITSDERVAKRGFVEQATEVIGSTRQELVDESKQYVILDSPPTSQQSIDSKSSSCNSYYYLRKRFNKQSLSDGNKKMSNSGQPIASSTSVVVNAAMPQQQTKQLLHQSASMRKQSASTSVPTNQHYQNSYQLSSSSSFNNNRIQQQQPSDRFYVLNQLQQQKLKAETLKYKNSQVQQQLSKSSSKQGSFRVPQAVVTAAAAAVSPTATASTQNIVAMNNTTGSGSTIAIPLQDVALQRIRDQYFLEASHKNKKLHYRGSSIISDASVSNCGGASFDEDMSVKTFGNNNEIIDRKPQTGGIDSPLSANTPRPSNPQSPSKQSTVSVAIKNVKASIHQTSTAANQYNNLKHFQRTTDIFERGAQTKKSMNNNASSSEQSLRRTLDLQQIMQITAQLKNSVRGNLNNDKMKSTSTPSTTASSGFKTSRAFKPTLHVDDDSALKSSSSSNYRMKTAPEEVFAAKSDRITSKLLQSAGGKKPPMVSIRKF